MALEEDIAAAIDADLPNQIGVRLKQRLADCELIEENNIKLEAWSRELEKKLDRLKRFEDLETELQSRQEAITDKEHELELRCYKLTTREEYADKARADMHMMMGTIFKCPDTRKLAFDLYGNANGVTNAQGYQDNPSVSLSGSISDESTP